MTAPQVRYLGEIRVIIEPGYTQRELLESLLGAVDLAIVVVTTQGDVALWNDAFARASRRTMEGADLVAGGSLAACIPEMAAEIRGRDWIATVLEVTHTGVSYAEKRVPLRLGASAPAPHDVTVHALRRRDGGVIGAVLVLADVSEQVKLEKRLTRIARTTSLANLGASVAHEIRNPLNSIGLNLQRLQERLQDEPKMVGDGTVEILEMVGDEVKRLERIVRDFLKFSRPPQAQRSEVDLKRLLVRCLAVLEQEAHQGGVELRQSLGELSPIHADPDLITQVFQNLLLNAIQAARQTQDERPARVDVAGFETADAIAIQIRDSGPGLPPEAEREKIFDLFYSTKEGGTGLGLAIANRLVEDHGGGITAENQQEGSEGVSGAVFTVYLPKAPPGPEELSAGDDRWK